jgi:putative tricarboxylic transport membrane protein
MMERSLCTALEMSQGDFGIFLESPIAVVLLLTAMLILIAPAFQFIRKKKETLAGEEGA